jgi:16S rRNA G527 N7-methylase RsmG
MPIGLRTRSSIRSHASLKKRIAFFKAKQANLHCTGVGVAHAEVEPLPVALGVGVNAKVEVVVERSHLSLSIFTCLGLTVPQPPIPGCHLRTGC